MQNDPCCTSVSNTIDQYFALYVCSGDSSAGALLRDGSSFRTGWIESYLKMHSSLTRAVTDDRLLVMHTDLAALEQLADREATVIRVNPSNFSNIAYVVVDAADTSALDLIRDLPSVQLVIRNRVVLFCH